jgi:hypothetical protein
MYRIIKYLLVSILAFVVGVSAAWYLGFLTKSEVLLAKAFPQIVFSPNGRGCGCNWSQDYSLLDGRYLSESSVSSCLISETRPKPVVVQEKVQSIIESATKIIKRVPKSKNSYGAEGERIELLYVNNQGEERAKILWYGGGESFFEIDAPTLELGIVFEESKASIDVRAVEQIN